MWGEVLMKSRSSYQIRSRYFSNSRYRPLSGILSVVGMNLLAERERVFRTQLIAFPKLAKFFISYEKAEFDNCFIIHSKIIPIKKVQ